MENLLLKLADVLKAPVSDEIQNRLEGKLVSCYLLINFLRASLHQHHLKGKHHLTT